MFLQPTLSLMGIYKYDPTIFDGLTLPTGMDKSILIDELLMQSAELEVVYPRADILKLAITNFSRINYPIWLKMYNSTNFSYNPLWNVDGTVIETEKGTRTYENEQSNKDTSNTTNSVNGYNTGSGWTAADKTENEYNYGKKEKSKETPNITKETRRTGNIGVTKTTELIDDYRKTEAFNVYQFIIDAIISRFCLMIY